MTDDVQYWEMIRRTVAQRFTDGDRETLVVTTVLDSPALPADENHPGWFMDRDWVDWLPVAYPGYTWLTSRQAGGWMGSDWKVGDVLSWVAVGVRATGYSRDDDEEMDEDDDQPVVPALTAEGD